MFEKILDDVANNIIDVNKAELLINEAFICNLEHTCLDNMREVTQGHTEVIYSESKTPNQIKDIAFAMKERNAKNVLFTRISQEKVQLVKEVDENAVYFEVARIAVLNYEEVKKTGGVIVVICAGTSDIEVAEEAAITAQIMGNEVKKFYDVGISGLHRLLAKLEYLRKANVVVAVAGMEGALPSVVKGLIKAPVIAVPTSVGYGVSNKGQTALNAMLNSCSTGISVVNIDNGFGAGYIASLINKVNL